MPDIGHISYTSSSGGLSPIARPSTEAASRIEQSTAPSAEAVSSQASNGDRVDLSEHARWLDALRRMPSVRAEKVAQLKAEIEKGTYDTDEKLAIAIDRMLDEQSEA